MWTRARSSRKAFPAFRTLSGLDRTTTMGDNTRVHEPGHLFNAGQQRERLNVARWLDVRGHLYLHDALAFPPGPIWIGLGLSRSIVFNKPGMTGDIDIIMGTLKWNMSADDWAAARERWRANSPAHAHPSWLEWYAMGEAASEGKLVWDPAMNRLDALEAKASWFDPEQNAWKQAHESRSKQVKVAGQLRVLQAAGFDRVALLHLAATAPRETEKYAWWQASDDALLASASFPEILPAASLGGCGYFRAVTGAIPGKTEELAGAGGTLEICAPALPNVVPTEASLWRGALYQRLASLGEPRFPPPVYVIECARCKKWLLSQRATDDGKFCSKACAER